MSDRTFLSLISRGSPFPFFCGIFIPKLNIQLNSREYCRLYVFQSPNEFVICRAPFLPSSNGKWICDYMKRRKAPKHRTQSRSCDDSVCQVKIRWRCHRLATNWNVKCTIARTARYNLYACTMYVQLLRLVAANHCEHILLNYFAVFIYSFISF